MANSTRVIFVPLDGKPMNEAQLRAALASLSAKHPARRAIVQLIAGALSSATSDAADPKLDPTKGTHAGGRIEALALLRADLEGLWGTVGEEGEGEDGE